MTNVPSEWIEQSGRDVFHALEHAALQSEDVHLSVVDVMSLVTFVNRCGAAGVPEQAGQTAEPETCHWSDNEHAHDPHMWDTADRVNLRNFCPGWPTPPPVVVGDPGPDRDVARQIAES